MREIRVFGAEWCGNCKNLVNWLKQKEIKHEYVDVERDMDGAYQYWLADRGVRSLPAVLINGELIVGFDVDKIQEVLE